MPITDTVGALSNVLPPILHDDDSVDSIPITVSGINHQILVTKAQLLTVPYFAALYRFSGSFNIDSVDLKRFTNLRLSFDNEDQETQMWTHTLDIISLAVISNLDKAKEMLVQLGKESLWIKPKTLPVVAVKRATPSVKQKSVVVTLPKSKASTPSKATKGIPPKPPTKSVDSRVPPTEPKPEQKPPQEIPDFLVLWQLLYSISDFLSIDTLKSASLHSLYVLSHDLDCGCTQCIGIVIKFSIITFDIVGLEEFVSDTVFVMAKTWHKVYTHPSYPSIHPSLHELIRTSIIASIDIETILLTLSTLLDIKSRINLKSIKQTPDLETLLVSVDDKLNRVLGFSTEPKVPTRRIHQKVQLKTCNESAEMLQAVWDSDPVLKGWVNQEIRIATHPNIGAKQQSQRYTRVIETLTPTVEDFVARFVDRLDSGNVVGLLNAFDEIVGRIKLQVGRAIQGDEALPETVADRVFGDGFNKCLLFASKRWLNLGIKQSQLSEYAVSQLCLRAGITQKELFN
ncbi:UNVERIFIED_CONTAM: hypothetical protein HDU68_001684 [Siphonaria sp. JEL0065]|nr:hypothetical protein HDU68_001684 [Siphonaria sp. JEL0065]